MNKKVLIPLLCLVPMSLTFNANVNTQEPMIKNANKTELVQDFHGETLTIYNCEDYIDEALVEEFEQKYNCKVNYYTYDTNETMYNQFTLQPQGTYDLICTSDYMIQRMVREGLVQPFDIPTVSPVYDQYASVSIRGKLKSMYADTDKDGEKDTSLDKYAAGYMWGTLGIIYDPFYKDTTREDVKSWDVFWNPKYEDKISIKNSMRDTFVVGLMHAYYGSEYTDVDEYAKTARETYLKEKEAATTPEELIAAEGKYNKVIQDIFDLVLTEENPDEVLNVVKDELIALKQNIFGLEVDSGKNDIITGKIKMNLAWSGDAVYSIGQALESRNKVLEYYVPDDGSNVWYDGWTMPVGANTELAGKFIDYLSEPANAARNMNYIGFTSFITCDEVFDLVTDWYGVQDFYLDTTYHAEDEENELDASIVKYNDKFYRALKETKGNLPTDTNYFEEVTEDLDLDEPYDLSHLFSGHMSEGKSTIVYPYKAYTNQLQTQYPDNDTLVRCAVMNDFEEANEKVVIMWGQVKAYTNMIPYYVILGIFAGGFIVFITYKIISKSKSSRNKRRLQNLTK